MRLPKDLAGAFSTVVALREPKGPPRRATATACMLALVSGAQTVAAQGAYADASADTPSIAMVEPTITVVAERERATGPVDGYRATRSSTFTKTDMPLKEVPATITVVPANLMRDLAYTSIGDIMRYVPGASVHQGEGNRDQVVLRGNNTSADFFVDGVRDDAQVFRDAYNLERIEILKGPGGMAFGRGGAGGVVNRVTKRPEMTPTRDLMLTVGSNTQKRFAIDIGDRLANSLAARVNAVTERDGSFRDGVNIKRDAINPALAWHVSERTAIAINAEYLRDARTADRGVPSRNGTPLDVSPNTFIGNAAQSTARGTVNAGNLSIAHAFAPEWVLKNVTRIAHYDKFYQNVYPGSAVSANNTLQLAAYNNANQRTNIFNQTDLSGIAHTWGVAHKLLLGAEFGTQDSRSVRNSGFFGEATTATIPSAQPSAVATRFSATGSDANSQVDARVAAVYAQDLIELSTQLKALLGVRWDRYEVNFDDRRSVAQPTDLLRTDNAASPRVGLIWNIDSHTTAYASLSTSFLPSAETLSLATTTSDLAPERARNVEFGARSTIAHGLTLSAAIFRLQRQDVRVSDPLRPGFFVKTGQQQTDGVELGLQGSVTTNWQVFAGYAWLDSRVKNALVTGTTANAVAVIPAGRKVGLVPEHAMSAWNKFTLNAEWALGLGVSAQTKTYTSFTNAVTLPRFARADAAIYYTAPSQKWRASLNVENLANARYYPTADGDNNISVGAPCNAKLTLAMSF